MTPKRRVLLMGGLVISVAFVLVVWNPGALLTPDLRSNLEAEALGAVATLLIVDLALAVVPMVHLCGRGRSIEASLPDG